MIKEDYVAWSCDKEIREKASSGGVGSALVKYLFATKQITAALSFAYDAKSLRYRPLFARDFNEYQITGSIYQEMGDIYSFYEANLTYEVVGDGPVLVFSLPCQTRAIRAVAERSGVVVIIVGLVCSSQQSFGATEYILRRTGIKKEDVAHIQYRGNGWPSGIQIILNNHTTQFVPNNGSIWEQIFHSRLFIQRRCFFCEDTLNRYSDIVLADPWRPYFVKTEKVGKTFVRLYTELGRSLFQSLCEANIIEAEKIEDGEFDAAQQLTVDRKKSYRNNKVLTRWMIRLFQNNVYRLVVLLHPMLFSRHIALKNRIEELLRRENKGQNIS